jgi:anti-sigma B factor antagonist
MVGDDRLSVELTRTGVAECRVHLVGDIDFSSAPDLRAQLHQVISEGVSRLVMDVSGVAFCDSSGLGVLVGARALLLARGGTLVVEGAAGQVARLLEITGLERLFTPGATAARPAVRAG